MAQSTDVTELRSFKSFLAWLREHDRSKRWFGRVGFDARSLLVSREPVWKFAWDSWTQDSLPLYPLNFPAASPVSTARNWWRDLFEQQFSETLRHQSMRIYCLVRVGVWRSLPDICVQRAKREWRIIARKEFQQEIGPDLWRVMVNEHQFFGFSIRNLSTVAFTRPV